MNYTSPDHERGDEKRGYKIEKGRFTTTTRQLRKAMTLVPRTRGTQRTR